VVRLEREAPLAAEVMHVNRAEEMWQGLIAYRASCVQTWALNPDLAVQSTSYL